MRIEMKVKKFRLDHADAFDARRGFRRCTLPEIGVSVPAPSHCSWLPDTKAKAYFWRNRKGGLFVRVFFNEGYTYHFHAKLTNGKTIPTEDMEEFGEYIADFLWEWILEGVDDWPEFCY
jgi:hypothetical protein